MPDNPKILLLDDESDTLELYQQYLLSLPSQPTVKTCESGTKALSLLESETFNLMISDLNMPKMDGLQVLSIVRRKFPAMKIMVMTAVVDDQFRARAYSLGVDLFWQKPSSEQEIKTFLDGVQSVLQRSESGGFRGVQSKSLVDIVQLECLSHSSTVLKITNGGMAGRIWIFNGELVDAELGDLVGEEAFKKVMTWRAGNFENLPADPDRERKIFNTVDGLLLDVVQIMDENQAREAADGQGAEHLPEDAAARATPMQESVKVKGLDFLLVLDQSNQSSAESWGVENSSQVEKWVAETRSDFRALGENFVAGNLKEIQGRSLRRNLSVLEVGNRLLCVGFQRSLTVAECRETLNAVISKWVS
jgi:CheY-like chemotaxis protein